MAGRESAAATGKPRRSRRGRIWKAAALVALIFVGGVLTLIAAGYAHHMRNMIGYLFAHEPYINRVFVVERISVDPRSDLARTLIHDPDMDDRRWGTAAFDEPVERRITIPHSADERRGYEHFVALFKERFRGRARSDAMAEDLLAFVHGRHIANLSKPEFDASAFEAKPEKDRRPEEVILSFANYRSACGTVSETAVALLRDLGFRTRLLRVSLEPGVEVANHVFVEYYAPDYGKWVMFDALTGFMPRRDGVPLSAIEFFSDPTPLDGVAGNEVTYSFYIEGAEIWWQKNGPIKTIYRMRIQGADL